MIPGLLVALSFLLGAVPFGLIVAKAMKGVDVREHGSGNIGATNVLRVAGKPAAAAVFTLDVLKGLVPPLIAMKLSLGPTWQVVAGSAAILGHMFSPFLGFKGGKGIATSLGLLVGVAPKVALAGFLLWIVLVALTRYVSVASIAAAVSLTPFSLLFYPDHPALVTFAIIAGIIGLIKHRDNIRRLMNGTENRFGKKNEGLSETTPSNMKAGSGSEPNNIRP